MLNVVVTSVAVIVNVTVALMTNGDWQTAGSGFAAFYWNNICYLRGRAETSRRAFHLSNVPALSPPNPRLCRLAAPC